MNYRRFKEMFGKDAELFHVALAKNNRFFIEIEGEIVAVFDANLSSKFLGQPEAERAIMKYFTEGNAHAWEALDKDTNETYYLISDGPDGADRGKVYRMKIAEFIKSLGEDSERLEIFESKKHRRFALIIDFVCVATVDSELSAKFWGNKQGLIEYMRAERCHVWKTSGEFYFIISDGPDISLGQTFSWDDL